MNNHPFNYVLSVLVLLCIVVGTPSLAAQRSQSPHERCVELLDPGRMLSEKDALTPDQQALLDRVKEQRERCMAALDAGGKPADCEMLTFGESPDSVGTATACWIGWSGSDCDSWSNGDCCSNLSRKQTRQCRRVWCPFDPSCGPCTVTEWTEERCWPVLGCW